MPGQEEATLKVMGLNPWADASPRETFKGTPITKRYYCVRFYPFDVGHQQSDAEI